VATLFTKIVKGEIPCYKVAETESFFAFLDISPLTKGHTLVIPKVETDYIFDMNDKLFADLHVFSKKVAIAIEKVITCQRIGVAVIGLEVPHVHIHLVPINNVDDINFSRPKLKILPDEMREIASAIQSEFDKK